MPTCPMCKKTLTTLRRTCPTCQANLSLLVDFVEQTQTGIDRAEAHTKAGELGEAVWAYLEVLEVDPDNPEAKRQVGQVTAAVRSFDRAAPGRRWQRRLERANRFRQWLTAWEGGVWGSATVAWLLALVLALVLAYCAGRWHALALNAAEPQASLTGRTPLL